MEKKKDVKGLIKALKHKDIDVWKRALRALGAIGKPAVEPLICALEDEHETVRWAAANALGEIGDARAVEPLIQALRDENRLVRSGALVALGKMGKPAVEPLIRALADKNSGVRWWVVATLRTVGDERAIEPLKQALEDEDALVRSAAKGALWEIKARKNQE